MKMQLRLAFRNVFRNQSRLILNLLLLVGAFTSLVIFDGFEKNVLQTMQDIITDTQIGHLQIMNKPKSDSVSTDSVEESEISDSEFQSLQKSLLSQPNVEYASARLSFYSLFNYKNKSIPTRIIAFDQTVESKMQNRIILKEGSLIQHPKEFLIGKGLNKILNLTIGDELTALSQNKNGSLNAMDLKLVGIIATGFSEIDNTTAFMSTVDAKKLRDTNSVNNVIIQLKDKNKISKSFGEISKTLTPNLKLKTWRQISDFFLQVESYFNFQNLIVKIILILLLFLCISNTASMTINERLGEIGTLQAMGDQPIDIKKLLFLEIIFFIILSLAIAVPFSIVMMTLLSSVHFLMTLPMASEPLPLNFIPTFSAYFEAGLICAFVSLFASFIPISKISKISIINALRAKI